MISIEQAEGSSIKPATITHKTIRVIAAGSRSARPSRSAWPPPDDGMPRTKPSKKSDRRKPIHRTIALLLVLWPLGGCAVTGPGLTPSPPPSQDDRSGMH